MLYCARTVLQWLVTIDSMPAFHPAAGKGKFWRSSFQLCLRSYIVNMNSVGRFTAMSSAVHSTDFWCLITTWFMQWDAEADIQQSEPFFMSFHCYMCTLLILCQQSRNVILGGITDQSMSFKSSFLLLNCISIDHQHKCCIQFIHTALFLSELSPQT